MNVFVSYTYIYIYRVIMYIFCFVYYRTGIVVHYMKLQVLCPRIHTMLSYMLCLYMV